MACRRRQLAHIKRVNELIMTFIQQPEQIRDGAELHRPRAADRRRQLAHIKRVNELIMTFIQQPEQIRDGAELHRPRAADRRRQLLHIKRPKELTTTLTQLPQQSSNEGKLCRVSAASIFCHSGNVNMHSDSAASPTERLDKSSCTTQFAGICPTY